MTTPNQVESSSEQVNGVYISARTLLAESIPITADEKERFLEQVDKSGDCWNWSGSKSGHGYGAFYLHGKSLKAHRVSYIIHHGKIPAGEVVLHDCDRSECVNPDHLKTGTQSQNLRDCFKRKRHSSFTHPEKHVWGEKVSWAKLTNAQVLSIRQLLADGMTQAAIARQFGVAPATIRNIKFGTAWKRLTTPTKASHE